MAAGRSHISCRKKWAQGSMEPSAESPSPPSVTGNREEAGVRLLPSLGARKTSQLRFLSCAGLMMMIHHGGCSHTPFLSISRLKAQSWSHISWTCNCLACSAHSTAHYTVSLFLPTQQLWHQCGQAMSSPSRNSQTLQKGAHLLIKCLCLGHFDTPHAALQSLRSMP